MPSKGRWTLNPRKWFGTLSSASHKPDRKSQIINSTATGTLKVAAPIPAPATTITTREMPSTLTTTPRLLTARNKIKAMPTFSTMNDNNSSNAVSSYTQFQLPAFNMQREKSATLLSSSKFFNNGNLLVPKRTEPSIRKNVQLNETLSIDTTRCNNEQIINDRSKLLSSSHGNFLQQNSIDPQQSQINISILSNECIVDFPQSFSNHFLEKFRPSIQTRSSSSMDDNDIRDESTSSGIFTDERTDINDGHRSPSKDTLSILDIISVESIDDSQTSLNHCQSHSFVPCHRLLTSTLEINDNKLSPLQRQKPIGRSHRTCSAEDILKDNQINTPVITKSRQSSAAIVKKIEKRIPTNRSPTATLEKSGFVRIANDTYRLTMDKDNHLYRRQHRNSIIQCSNYDDSLPPANDEESYATIPRTSSTEQLNDNLQNDARAIVDDCLRPIVASINKTSDRSRKHHHRSKRSHTNNEPIQINIDDMIVFSTSSSSSLNTYCRIHSGEKPYIYEICQKSFIASSNFYYHRMTYNSSKPHQCLQCSKTFVTPGDLRYHIHINNGIWPFRCSYCNHGF
ncbi:unnamed protein product [Rotaria sordida]|uniref:C2H2-type domain-containing protein n=1 Tax=Rotaria sordida TaxID=392033 RepID=A0A814SGP9_9BILA|nr:unnamed protein product [Rotaria sordida]CAF3872484.1 unnamed protein product [Rotaria sordida]